jgi:hypothetical protein
MCLSVLCLALKRRKPTYYVVQRHLRLLRLFPAAFPLEGGTAKNIKRWTLQLPERR